MDCYRKRSINSLTVKNKHPYIDAFVHIMWLLSEENGRDM